MPTRAEIKNQQIQREQIQLVGIQRELEGTLAKVNEAINALKVEELHLKSSAITSSALAYQRRPTDGISLTSAFVTGGEAHMDTIVDVTSVNAQVIDLDTVFVCSARRGSSMEEEEEEGVVESV